MASTTVIKASESPVEPAQVLKATTALIVHMRKDALAAQFSSAKRDLLSPSEEKPGAETPIYLTITTKKNFMETKKLKPSKIMLPHALSAPETICLITASPQRAYKNAVAASDFGDDELRAKISRVIDLDHLSKKFKSYESKRGLLREHQCFLADERIVNRLPKALGTVFYKSTTKRPIPITLSPTRPRDVNGKRIRSAPKHALAPKKPKRDPLIDVNARPPKEIATEIKRAIGATTVSLGPSNSTAVRIGMAGWEPSHVAANAAHVAAEITRRFVSDGWAGVRSVFVKGPQTAALPVWQTEELWVEGAGQVLPDGEKAAIGKKRKGTEEEEEGKDEQVKEVEAEKGPKTSKKAKLVANTHDQLDKEMLKRKAELKKQKSMARRSLDV